MEIWHNKIAVPKDNKQDEIKVDLPSGRWYDFEQLEMFGLPTKKWKAFIKRKKKE